MATKGNEEVKEATPKREKAPVVVQDKLTKVTPKFTGKRKIGADWYDFVAGKETEVSQDAKRVLLEAKAIYI